MEAYHIDNKTRRNNQLLPKAERFVKKNFQPSVIVICLTCRCELWHD